MKWGSIVTRIYLNLRAVVFLNKAMRQGLKEIEDKTEWFDEKLDRGENKQRMKEFGGSLGLATDYTRESTILFLARTVEDVLFDLKQLEGVEYRSEHLKDLIFYKEIRELRLLSNVVRHNTGHILQSGGSSSKSLISEYGYHDQEYVGRIPFDFELKVFQVYRFCFDILVMHYKISFSPSDNYKEFFETLYPSYVYDSN